MEQKIISLEGDKLPKPLREIPDSPKKIYLWGNLPLENYIPIVVVGARKCSSYGEMACEKIIRELKPYPVVIISGLALGIDAIAHRCALDAGIPTIGVLGSGLDEEVIYPRINLQLAKDIVKAGGGIISELPPKSRATKYTFPQRNRIMAALSQLVVIIECEVRSGTLITARLALEYNKDVVAVPGSIFSNMSAGTNKLIKEGATPISGGADIAEFLNIKKKEYQTMDTLTENEKLLLNLLTEPISKNELIEGAELEIHQVIATLTLLELKGLIKEKMGKIYRR